ncbi:MAG: 1-aminocyclopropane-1-carboxylate deaminase/D-cysteine desulfhydrase [Bacteroidota bacterium]
MSELSTAIAAQLRLDPPLQVFHLPAGDVWIQRDDLIHPIISGNKWRKLQGHFRVLESQGKRVLITYGGAYSNHLVATAVAAQAAGIACIGILRGDEPLDNRYLQVAREAGLKLVGVSRSLYRNKQAALEFVLAQQGLTINEVYVVAEGGKGEAGVEGFEALVEAWQGKAVVFDHVFHASATATTALGLRRAMNQRGMDAQVHAVMVLKNLQEQVSFAHETGLLNGIEFLSDHEFGGYAKSTESLHAFIDLCSGRNAVPLDWVYTGKALFALNEWLLAARGNGLVNPDAMGVYPVIFLHTGGVLRRPE